MPWSDEERLERVYRKAATIRLVRRARVLALALPVLVLAGAVVAAASNDDGERRLQVAGPGPTRPTLPTLPPGVETTTTVDLAPPAKGPGTTIPKAPIVTVPPTTTTTVLRSVPDKDNCGGYMPGDTQPSKPPTGMKVTTEVSKKVVHRGDKITLTLRATWTGAEPYTHARGQDELVFVHLDGLIAYSSQYDDSAPRPGRGDETFQPGEEKTYTVTWDTSVACGYQPGLMPARLKAGTYTVDGSWSSTDATWNAERSTFEVVD